MARKHDYGNVGVYGLLRAYDELQKLFQSHKLKKRIPTTKEQQAIFRNTHKPIVFGEFCGAGVSVFS